MSFFVGSVQGQTPEITATARSAAELQRVIAALGEKGEMFGLNGPYAFLESYAQHIDVNQPIIAVLTVSSTVPMFAVDLSVSNYPALLADFAKDGFQFDQKTGELTKADSGLRFFVQPNGRSVRIADNAGFLKSVRWPAATKFTGSPSEASVVVNIDWRNINPATRRAVSMQALTMAVPQENLEYGLSIDAIPAILSDLVRARVAGLCSNSETLTLRFTTDESPRVQLTADVMNRYLVGNRPVPFVFAANTGEGVVAQCQWNLPLESELKTFVQAWATQFPQGVKGIFAGDQIENNSGLSVLQDSASVLARHSVEAMALNNLQGSLLVQEDGSQAVIGCGVRVANSAKLDGDIQRLLKAAVAEGAPLKLQLNVPSSNDMNLHRVELPIDKDFSIMRELFGEQLTIHFATTSHALLVGFGTNSHETLTAMVAPGGPQPASWLSGSVLVSTAGGQPKPATQELARKLGLTRVQVEVSPSAQGFRLSTTLPARDIDGPTQLTRTREVQPTDANPQ
ncbi:MAG: hypothetical protein IT423_10765 [Pirellulaceae bacterium]|nr:hypothetical protein [Pirellulaceae bacterium]